jgi:hypothetical protein
MAKLEIGDAFEMRGRIAVGLVVMMILACVASWMGLKWLMVCVSTARLRAKI